MHPVGKTLWYIETHLSDELTVEQLADVAQVSSYHLVRSFGTVTGLPLMRYVRYRRLSKAAVDLSASDLRILDIAMNSGYSSHEAFTHAFVACFGVPPETLRSANNLQDLKLVEPIKMNDMPLEKTVRTSYSQQQAANDRRPEKTVQFRDRRWNSQSVGAVRAVYRHHSQTGW